MKNNNPNHSLLGSCAAISVVFFWSAWIGMLTVTVTVGILLALGVVGYRQEKTY